MGKSKAAPAPDMGAIAQQQGIADREAAQYNTNANRVNQYGPNGSITWSLRPGADPNNPQPGDYSQTTSLSPEQQGLQDSSNRISQQYANTAEKQMGRVDSSLSQPFDTSGAPALQGSYGGDYAAQRKSVEDAYMARLNPSLDQNQQATESRLMNSGIEKGSEAWNREMNNLNMQRTDAQNQAILMGGQEQSRLAGLDRDAATFQNQARTQGLSESAYQRGLALNETNALRTGAQVQAPQFGSYYTGGQTQAAPMFDAAVAQGGFNSQAGAQRQSGNNALLEGLASLGGAWMGTW